MSYKVHVNRSILECHVHTYMYVVLLYSHTHRYQFKANPINPDIFRKGGLHGVPRKKTEVHLTEAHTPQLATKSRSLKRRAEEMSDMPEEEEEDQTVFHAQPMPNFNKVTVSYSGNCSSS